ncbi:DUF1214 domain-containing protein [Criblamydia sequanensis]|uniref:Secreted protein n=1 Tax=Candidatus Criblamydia sequanensis CRIB-18 TaxID=1437425 RepID=A0A090D0Q2_9BACT|nr:DUF1214 domain-containing protein [Criblamydia sequanensis]CDR33153.1 putative secreted protein [Criblamydia sequanensis CRIB-18]
MSMKSLWVFVIFMAIFGSGLLFANLNQNKEDLIEETTIYGYPLALKDATNEVRTKTNHPTSRKAPLKDLSKEPLVLKVLKIPIVDRPFSDSEDLKFNEDGSLDILIQKEKPKDTFNWLPSPQLCRFMNVKVQSLRRMRSL